MTDGMMEIPMAPPGWQDRMTEVVEAFNALGAVIEDRMRSLMIALRPILPALRRANRQLRLADHRRRQHARRVQAKAYRRQRSGR